MSHVKPPAIILSDDYLSNPAKPGLGAVMLRNIILGLALQQQVLGIAILSARYASCNITVYHSQIVRILALFSLAFFWFGFSLWDLIVNQQHGTYEMNTGTGAKENEWSFEILPMIACGLPILAAIQELLKDRRKEKEHDLDSAATHLLLPMLPGSAAAFNAASPTQRPLPVWSNTTNEPVDRDV